MCVGAKKVIQVSHVSSTRHALHALKGQKFLAQGIALGKISQKTKRPVRAKALIINAFALTGRILFIYPYTQGDALG